MLKGCVSFYTLSIKYVNYDVYFLDYNKVFDKVQYKKLAGILSNIVLNYKNLRTMVNLYQNQTEIKGYYFQEL